MPSSQRPRGRPAGSTASGTRAALLRAAREVFAEQGYGGAAIGEIVARAGVSPPVLYHHFASKAGIYAAATAEVYDTVLAGLAEAVAGRISFAECVDQILLVSVRMHAADATMAAFIVSTPVEVSTYPDLALLGDELQRTQAFFEHVVAVTGGIPGYSPEASVQVLRMLVWGMTRLSASLGESDEFEGAVDALRAVVLSGAIARTTPAVALPQ
jgi:AcrR family transcriptional regulator